MGGGASREIVSHSGGQQLLLLAQLRVTTEHKSRHTTWLSTLYTSKHIFKCRLSDFGHRAIVSWLGRNSDMAWGCWLSKPIPHTGEHMSTRLDSSAPLPLHSTKLAYFVSISHYLRNFNCTIFVPLSSFHAQCCHFYHCTISL